MWYFELNGTQRGPEETAQIQQRLHQGELSSGTLLWREGMTDWTPLGQIPELQGAVAAPANSEAPHQGAIPQHPQGVPGAGAMPTQNGLALTSMILAICSIPLTMFCFVGFFLAIPAVVLGHISRKQIRESSRMQTGEGMAMTGLIIGYIVVGLMVLMGIFVGISIATEGASAP